MVERSITAVLKTVDGNIRGFESLSLRQNPDFRGFFCAVFQSSNASAASMASALASLLVLSMWL